MPYLAMTAAEFQQCESQPGKIAWMACHFSPYGPGLTNLPGHLPEGSLLILNDRTPVSGHDPGQILATMERLVREFRCSGVLLDFQRPGSRELDDIVQRLQPLPCPVCVSHLYSGGQTCPVFLPPVPLLQTPEEYLAPWKGREIWLELALDGISVTLTEAGATTAALPPGEMPDCPHWDGELLCRYRLRLSRDRAVFTLHRTKDSLHKLLARSAECGVTQFVGLWQELALRPLHDATHLFPFRMDDPGSSCKVNPQQAAQSSQMQKPPVK